MANANIDQLLSEWHLEYQRAGIAPCPMCAGSGIALNDTHVGAFMRGKRLEAMMTGKEMAELMAISPQYLADLERGRRRWTHELANRCLKAIADWLNYLAETEKVLKQLDEEIAGGRLDEALGTGGLTT